VKELKALVHVRTFDVAEKVYNDKGTSQVKLTYMFCPKASVYSKWRRDISHLNIPNDSLVAEFEFLVQGANEEEQIRAYLESFGLSVLEI
jgi:hypothetical protein